jgi:hypothetical protein
MQKNMHPAELNKGYIYAIMYPERQRVLVSTAGEESSRG